MALALEGIRIIDISRTGPTAFCTMILADMGAEVIKVETPRETAGPYLGASVSPLASEEGEFETAYKAINRNKKSVAINLKSTEGQEIFYRLAKVADVVVEGFRPGVVKRLGIDYPTVSELNPRIIYCSISGYGQDGPYANFPGHDPNYISHAGVLGLIGKKGEPPVLPLNIAGDWVGGALYPTIGILLALLARDRTGQGQYIDISMTDGALSLLVMFISEYFQKGIVPEQGSSFITGANPFIGVCQTKDEKYITFAPLEPQFWENLCRALGREDFIPYQWATGEKKDEVLKAFQEVFLTKNRDEWFSELIKKDIPVGKVYSLDEVFNDPQIIHRRMVEEVEHAKLGKVKQMGIPIKLSHTPGQIRNFAPLLGQHSSEIFKELGYSVAELESFRQRKIIV
jgi:crotonobetainyl-CoA:carnitine CoA-transferase CaiB-like acyl-CoA transferase